MIYIKWSLLSAILFTVLTTLIIFKNKTMTTTKTLSIIQKFDSALLSQLKKEKLKKGKAYLPRTRHLNSKKEALFTNRLFLEKSPYLLQHAHNPVNWYPWGQEAFDTAKKHDLPILLSVGYSTCHWCHVMEEESFEDIEIATIMNQNYIAIKVDREERPDIDSIYMSTVQLTTGKGGWPMTVWLTPDKQIFYGGTYFQARTGDRNSSPGFLDLLKNLKHIYINKKEDIAKAGVEIQKALQHTLSSHVTADTIVNKQVFQKVYSQVKKNLDLEYGGVNRSPKFPSSFPTRFLLRSYGKTKNPDILKAVQVTLQGMQKGGLHDQVGGGFHRYSTDKKWLIPHFEKMLYDQALLALSYLEAYSLLKTVSYKQTAQGILDYIIRDMQSPEGGFYSATDADSLSPKTSQKEEGFYFTWTLAEVHKVLDKKSAQLIIKYYNLTSSGNYEGRNIFFISKDLSTVSAELNLTLTEAQKLLTAAKKILYKTRQLRPLPLRDQKILSGWNGLMISAFVYGYTTLNNKKYLLQAQKSAQFIISNMYKNNQLHRSYKNGEAYIPAYLDDYAFVIACLLDLFEATGNIKWLTQALKLDQILEQNFEDKNLGGFFMTGKTYEPLLVREKPLYDGAEPSGNSIQAMNLLRLSELTGDKKYLPRIKKILKIITPLLTKSPLSFSEALLALDYYHSNTQEIIIVAPPNIKLESDLFFKELKQTYLPNKVLTITLESDIKNKQNILLPLKNKKAINHKTTAYICEQGACQFPTTDLKTLKQQLKKIQSLDYN